jgi:hypothetical protein
MIDTFIRAAYVAACIASLAMWIMYRDPRECPSLPGTI